MRVAVAGGTGVVGRHVVEALRSSGHEPVVLSRSTGVDLEQGHGLTTALEGVGAVVDVTSVATTKAERSEAFFGAVTRHLLAAEDAAGVAHHVLLSIVGAAAVPAAYYAGKALQERLLEQRPGGWSILRATQFHEFAEQLVPQGHVGPLQVVPAMRSQPVAASEVGEALARLAVAAPQGLVPDVAGPQELRMAGLVRKVLRADGLRRPVLEVPLPGPWGRALRDGSLLPGPGAVRGRITFDEWLATRSEAARRLRCADPSRGCAPPRGAR